MNFDLRNSFVTDTLLQSSNSVNTHKYILREIEEFIVSLLKDFVRNGCAIICLPNTNKWLNFQVGEDMMLRQRSDLRNERSVAMREINYSRKRSQHRFVLFLYVLAEVHKKLLHGGRSTARELYYENILLSQSQIYINAALNDVSTFFQRPNWELGVVASGKGLVAGALNIILTNGDIIDCRSTITPTLIPTDFSNIECLETTANFVLLVEKDTVFEKLASDRRYLSISHQVVLVTGKGFPDISTRLLVNRLHYECSLPIYALVDADPFGIEILLVYRHGSRMMAHSVDQLACPKVHWIGIHPSEFCLMPIRTEILGTQDQKKLTQLLQREYVDLSVRRELQIMHNLQRKAEVEMVSCFSLSFLIDDYIPNKIKRNLVL